MALEEAWIRLIEVLRAVAPVTLASMADGAQPEDIADAEAQTEVSWPSTYRAWFSRVNGTSQTPETWGAAGWLFPSFELLSLADALEARSSLLANWFRPEADETEAFYQSPPIEAGSAANTFLPEYLPFAGRDGYFLFCDARPGNAHGCITEFAAENADSWGMLFSDFPSFLNSLTSAIEERKPLLGHQPILADRRLEWEIIDSAHSDAEDPASPQASTSNMPFVQSVDPELYDGDYLTIRLGPTPGGEGSNESIS